MANKRVSQHRFELYRASLCCRSNRPRMHKRRDSHSDNASFKGNLKSMECRGKCTRVAKLALTTNAERNALNRTTCLLCCTLMERWRG